MTDLEQPKNAPRVAVRWDTLIGSVPLDVRAQIAGRVRWLRDMLPKLDEELGIRYPTIEVIPTCWVGQMENGDPFSVHAAVTIVKQADTNMIIVQVSAFSLLVFSNDMVLGLLAHEFLHYVHFTVECAKPVLDLNVTPDGVTYHANDEEHARLDAAWQASIEDWLSPRLATLKAQFEMGFSDPAVKQALLTIKSWRDTKRFPVSVAQMDFRTEGSVTVATDVLAKYHRLPGLKVKDND